MRIKQIVGLILFSFFLVGCDSPRQALPLPYKYSVNVSGAVNRQIAQKEFYLEPAGDGREHIYIQEMGPGDDIKVLDVVFPESTQSQTYLLTSDEPAKAAYFEFVNDVSRQFHDNVQGTLVVNRSAGTVSGTFDFVAEEPLSGDVVRVWGEYEYTRPAELPAQDQNTNTAPALNNTLFLLIFLTLIFLNFIIQIYVGSIVYSGQTLGVLRSLRGTRTYILGWRDPSLREVMFVWTFVIVLIGGVLLFGLLLSI